MRSEQEGLKCHFFSNTHWDREWQTSMQRTRHMLVHLMDMILDILEKEPRYKHFNLDSQTVPLQDYLEIRPEREEQVRRMVRERRLIVGPWYTLPDQYSVSGESLIRNLLLGHRIARDFSGDGYVPKTGYSPFGWGHCSQMPQIYNGFGIDFMAFYRGVNSDVAPMAEFIWEGPDGSRLIASRLGARPRFNVWYVIQRPVFWGCENVNDRNTSWSNGHGPFRLIDEGHQDFFYRYAHARYAYHKDKVRAAVEQAIAEQDADWRTPHRFWANGHDLSCPDYREPQLVEDCNEALGNKGEVFQSTFEAFQDGVKACVSDDWPVATGEMRRYMKRGDKFGYMGSLVGSTRAHLKQHNFMAERTLMTYAEPLAVCASMLGAEYPEGFLRVALRWLLENHGHDSIGGCHRDVISRDIHFRLTQTEEIGHAVIEKAMMQIAGSVDLSDRETSDVALVVFNPSTFARGDYFRIVLDIPREMEHDTFEIVNAKGESLPLQLIDSRPNSKNNVFIPNDVQLALTSTRYHAILSVPELPPLGYDTFFVKPIVKPLLNNPRSLLTGPQAMENEYLRVAINANGTYDVTDKRTGRVFEGLGYFRDRSEVGSPHEHFTVKHEKVFTTLNERAEVCMVRDGEIAAAFEVRIPWALPDGITADKRYRAAHLKPYPIVSTLTLRKGQPWLEVFTEIDNTVEYHYLQVSFPTRVKTDDIRVQGHYDVYTRPIPRPDFSVHDEAPEREQPMDSFIDMSDGQVGLAIMNEGLKAYEADEDDDRTVSLTLLRCFSLELGWAFPFHYGEFENGTQNPGKHIFHYAVMPHAGDWREGGVWRASERFNQPLIGAQIGPTPQGSEPLRKSFLELEPCDLSVSAIKQSESGEGWIVRVFNPWDRTVQAGVRLNGGRAASGTVPSPVELLQSSCRLPGTSDKPWQTARLVSMEEAPQRDIDLDAEGWARFEITRKKILTIEFLP